MSAFDPDGRPWLIALLPLLLCSNTACGGGSRSENPNAAGGAGGQPRVVGGLDASAGTGGAAVGTGGVDASISDQGGQEAGTGKDAPSGTDVDDPKDQAQNVDGAQDMLSDAFVDLGVDDASLMPDAAMDQSGAPPLNAISVSAGWYSTCAVIQGGSVLCWGNGTAGELGNGSMIDSATPIQVVGISDAVAVAVGGEHACALGSNGSVKCWGSNNQGQLGDGTFMDSSVPVTVVDVAGGIAISAGEEYTCAVVTGGSVECWGANESGQLGDGTMVNAANAVTVIGLNGATAVAASLSHTCALLRDGSAKCWGANDYTELGSSTTADSPTAVTVSNLNGAIPIAVAAGGSHTCVLVSDGSVECWGRNFDGQLGIGGPLYLTTIYLNGEHIVLPVAIAIVAGYTQSCALLADQSVECWGANDSGQLGDGTTTSSSEPVPVRDLVGASVVTSSYDHACALLIGGSVECWGSNTYGQLGDGTTRNSSTPVAAVGS